MPAKQVRVPFKISKCSRNRWAAQQSKPRTRAPKSFWYTSYRYGANIFQVIIIFIHIDPNLWNWSENVCVTCSFCSLMPHKCFSLIKCYCIVEVWSFLTFWYQLYVCRRNINGNVWKNISSQIDFRIWPQNTYKCDFQNDLQWTQTHNHHFQTSKACLFNKKSNKPQIIIIMMRRIDKYY